jgi:rRNA maturation RNase YbeY
VKANATELKTTFNEELHRVLIHGVLHLSGYSDKSASDKSLMRKKEDAYLSLRDI